MTSEIEMFTGPLEYSEIFVTNMDETSIILMFGSLVKKLFGKTGDGCHHSDD